jgi:hypothetical protein
MKPYVICHMKASVGGRIPGSRWRPAENRMPGLTDGRGIAGDQFIAGEPCSSV